MNGAIEVIAALLVVVKIVVLALTISEGMKSAKDRNLSGAIWFSAMLVMVAWSFK